MPVKLPEGLRKKPAPQLKHVPFDRAVFTTVAAMVMTAAQECYLRSETAFQEQPDTLRFLKIERDGVGFHATLLLPWTWEPVEIKVSEDWIPLASIKVEIDSDLDPLIKSTLKK